MGIIGNHLISGINSLFLSFLNSNHYTRKIIEKLGEPYLAGHSLEEGLENILKQYHEQQRYSTFDILGEEAATSQDVTQYLKAYSQALDFIGTYFPHGNSPQERPASISVKPSAICLAVKTNSTVTISETTPLDHQVEILAARAREKGLDLTIDMEDHRWTDATLDAAQQVWKSGYDNVGIVLQSRLYRTQRDIVDRIITSHYPFPKEKIRVRSCIGVYREPRTIATRNKPEMKERLWQHLVELFDAGIYVEIATHDSRLVHRLIDDIILPGHYPPTRYEFQFLKGVYNGEKLGLELRSAGHTVRDYMPVELKRGDGTPYMFRRLNANPELLVNGMKNIIQKIFKR